MKNVQILTKRAHSRIINGGISALCFADFQKTLIKLKKALLIGFCLGINLYMDSRFIRTIFNWQCNAAKLHEKIIRYFNDGLSVTDKRTDSDGGLGD